MIRIVEFVDSDDLFAGIEIFLNNELIHDCHVDNSIDDDDMPSELDAFACNTYVDDMSFVIKTLAEKLNLPVEIVEKRIDHSCF